MASSVSYYMNDAYYKRPFDSTDKILDDIDAKLHGVTRPITHSEEVDVNDDPGIDPTSVQKLRQHMEYDVVSNTSKNRSLPEIDSSLTESDQTSESRKVYDRPSNLHQVYDDDINTLRRLLRENVDAEISRGVPTAPPPVRNEEKPSKNFIDSFSNESKNLTKTVQWGDLQVNDKQNDPISNNNHTPQVQEEVEDELRRCEDELEKMTKERDELRARIRRGEASRTSIEERQELERQLHATKSALFQQRKKSRQQLEDIEEKLEEAQHFYDEKLLQKDEAIEALTVQTNTKHMQQQTPNTGDAGRLNSRHREDSNHQPSNDIELQEKFKEKEVQIKHLEDESARQKQQIKDLTDEIQRKLENSNSSMQEKLAAENEAWQVKLDDIQAKSTKDKNDYEITIKALEEEREKMYGDVIMLTQKLQDFHKEIEERESQIKEENHRKEKDYKTTNEMLKNKIESLKEELSRSFAMNSELELELKRRETCLRQESNQREKELVEEKKKLEDELNSVQSEVTDAVTKLKEFKFDIEHQDQCLAASVIDECQKLSILLHSMQPCSYKTRNTFSSKTQMNGKKSVCELQEVVELVCRSCNEMICEVARLKREYRKRPDYSFLRNNSEISIASEEMKILRDKLDEKEAELQHLQINMNQWKDLTAQRLAEKFQEELQLQVERKVAQSNQENSWKPQIKSGIGRYSKSTDNLSGISSQSGDTSTVKLLSHLQGRVKQLRTENDLLRSSSFIKGLGNR